MYASGAVVDALSILFRSIDSITRLFFKQYNIICERVENVGNGGDGRSLFWLGCLLWREFSVTFIEIPLISGARFIISPMENKKKKGKNLFEFQFFFSLFFVFVFSLSDLVSLHRCQLERRKTNRSMKTFILICM